MPVTHREDHRDQLRHPGRGRLRGVDAVIVPAHRSASHLDPAAQLATELGCSLLLMCDPGGVDPHDFTPPTGLEWHAVTVPDGYRHRLLPGSAVPDPGSRDWRHGALSTKRNLSVLIARMVGWRTVFLVDDDMVDIHPDLVRTAAEGLHELRAVGLTVADYPDNSVVCHANRLSSPAQGVFVGACALVLDTTCPFGFFPGTYNEDWLFLFDNVAARQVGHVDSIVDRAGTVRAIRQLPYDPFADPGRARAEEFGDVIAEGLMAALRTYPSAPPPTDPGYWADFLVARAIFIRRAAIALPVAGSVVDREAILRSLRASRSRLGEIDANRCAEFVRTWRSDLELWHARLGELPSFRTVGAATDYLGLAASLAGLIA